MRFSLLALVVLAACGSSADITPPAPTCAQCVATTSVNMQGRLFVPPDIKVAPGATVSFTNLDGFNHNVVFAGTAIATVADFTTGTKTAVMPTTKGTYTFVCTRHAGMTGSVHVE